MLKTSIEKAVLQTTTYASESSPNKLKHSASKKEFARAYNLPTLTAIETKWASNIHDRSVMVTAWLGNIQNKTNIKETGWKNRLKAAGPSKHEQKKEKTILFPLQKFN